MTSPLNPFWNPFWTFFIPCALSVLVLQKDKLIVEALGGCWHEWEFPTDNPNLAICRKCHTFPPRLNLATWEGFGWWWERVQKMKWWDCFLDWINLQYAKGYLGPEFNRCLEFMIHPIRGRDALAEWLRNNEDKWKS